MDNRPRRHPESAFRSIGEEGGLVVLPRVSEVKVLNPVGSLVFAMLDGQHTVDEIVAAVLAEFDTSEEEARRDVTAFIAQLDKHGMLDTSTQPPEEPS